MSKRRTLGGLLVCALGAIAQSSRIDIPFEKFTLANGLTVIVHEDRKAPIVAVNIWYHVGSKNENRGKTGFAHLFEHLMFNGSEHFNQDYFKVLEKLGATDLNGTTNEDRTNYFQNVPTSALDTVLWMESDRMGHLLGVVDQARLDEQRGVVQNEKRQGENQPYGKVDILIPPSTYPANHPYSWSVIGSMEDLNAASLEDVREWFRTYYGPNNAVLALAGDIDVKTAREKVEKYFGAIPPGPPLAKHAAWIAKMTGTQRQVLEDRVPQARVYFVWNTPPDYTRDNDLLALAVAILSQGKTSRLYQRLVVRDQLATDVSAFIDAREIASQVYLWATARPGVDLAKVEAALRDELAGFLKSGPSPEELERAKTRYLAAFLRGSERIGGFGGKSDILARGQVFAANPAAYKQVLENRQKATPADVRETAAAWLGDGLYILEVRPFPKLDKLSKDADRSTLPKPGEPPPLRLPKFERATLSNGLKVVLAERHTTPIVNFLLAVDSGYSADRFSLPGAARLAMNMLDEGTRSRTSLEIGEQLEALGATLNTNANLDQATVGLSALTDKLDASLAIFADVILNPSFPAADFAREQKQQIAAIQREKAQPFSIALRLLPPLVYGSTHPYGMPGTGSGTEESVAKLTREDLVKFHETWFKPNNATLIVVGDTTMAGLRPRLEKLFAGWRPGTVPQRTLPEVAHQPHAVVYLVDRPGSLQSNIIAGHVAPGKNTPAEIAFEALNTLLGGAFISRVNMNLREDKHWTYGAGTFIQDANGQRMFVAFAPVQSDKTKESLVELDRELRDVTRTRPPTAEELAMAQDNQTLSLAGQRETTNAVLSSILEIVRFGLPDDYWETYTGKVRALKTQELAAAAEKLIRPDNLIWIVVGDRAKVEAGIRELNLGELRFIDADGRPVK